MWKKNNKHLIFAVALIAIFLLDEIACQSLIANEFDSAAIELQKGTKILFADLNSEKNVRS